MTPQELDDVTRTIMSEARGQSDDSLAGVAHVIKNRLDSGKWGKSPTNVVMARGEFEPWGDPNGRNFPRKHSADSPEYARTQRIAKGVFSGEIPDPTGGAMFFYDPKEQMRQGRKVPSWAQREPTAELGSHFYFGPTKVAQAADPLGHLDWGAPPATSGGPSAAAPSDPLGHLDWGSPGEPAAQAEEARTAAAAVTQRSVKPAGGRLELPDTTVYSPEEHIAGAARGLPAQFLGGLPIAGPIINLATAAHETGLPDPGKEAWWKRYGANFEAQTRADKAFAQDRPVASRLAAAAGGITGAIAGAATAPGRMLMGMSGPSTAARIYAGAGGGATINAVDAALRGENPLPAAAIGVVGGAAGPFLGEAAGVAGRGALNRATRPTSGSLANLSPHALDLLANRGLADLTPAEITQLRAEAGPNAFLGDVTPGLRDITTGVAGLQGAGRDMLRRVYQDRHAEGADRLHDILTRHIGPSSNIVDYTRLLTENRARAADPLYAQWRSTQVQPTPELKALIPRLESAGAFNAAEELAGIEGKNINRNFFTPGPQKAYPTTETWDLVKQGLDRRIDAAYSGGDGRLGRALVGLKHEMIDEIEKTPAGPIWRQARQEFADRSALIKQVKAGKDTLLGGRSGMTVDELREELRGLSGPERAARLVGMRSALQEDMGETQNGTARVGGRLLTPNAQEKMTLLLGPARAHQMINELRQEAFLRERLPYVVENPNTGASAVPRQEAVNLFRSPKPMEWNITQPSTYPMVGRMLPQNVLHDLAVAGRARSAPALAPILASQGQDLDRALADAMTQRVRLATQARRAQWADRLTAASSVPVTSTYRREIENERQTKAR